MHRSYALGITNIRAEKHEKSARMALKIGFRAEFWQKSARTDMDFAENKVEVDLTGKQIGADYLSVP